jgi:hypothetical protein
MNPDFSSQESPLTPAPLTPAPIERPTLVSLLAQTLEKFDPLCVTPSKVGRQYLLWFRPDEVAGVSAVWKEHGLDSVLNRWGVSRLFQQQPEKPTSMGSPAPVQPGALDVAIPSAENSRPCNLLMVMHFIPDPSPSKELSKFYRSRSLALSEILQGEVLEVLRDSGILRAVLPSIDSHQGIGLKDIPAGHVAATSEWYGRTNVYGQGNVLAFGIDLHSSPQKPIQLRLRFDETGAVNCFLSDPSVVATRYEGHETSEFELTPSQIKAVIPLFSKIAELQNSRLDGFNVAVWQGNSFIPGGDGPA